MPRLIPNEPINITKTREYWLAHLEAHEKSGLKSCQYAKNNNIESLDLSRWRWTLTNLGLWAKNPTQTSSSKETSNCHDIGLCHNEELPSQPTQAKEALKANIRTSPTDLWTKNNIHKATPLEKRNHGHDTAQCHDQKLSPQPLQEKIVSKAKSRPQSNHMNGMATNQQSTQSSKTPLTFTSVSIIQDQAPSITRSPEQDWDCRCHTKSGHTIEWSRPPTVQEWQLLLGGQ